LSHESSCATSPESAQQGVGFRDFNAGEEANRETKDREPNRHLLKHVFAPNRQVRVAIVLKTVS
jgi:hypothetical protein